MGWGGVGAQRAQARGSAQETGRGREASLSVAGPVKSKTARREQTFSANDRRRSCKSPAMDDYSKVAIKLESLNHCKERERGTGGPEKAASTRAKGQ